jgi:hypothetical protein
MSWWRVRRHTDSYTMPAPREYHRHEWSGALESAVPGIEWTAQWTVVWWSHGNRNGLASPESLAIVALHKRAAALAREAGFSDDVLQHELASELAQERSVADGRMWVSARDVRLQLTEHSAALVLRQREHVAQLAEIEHLRGSVLTDLPTAMLWWLQRNNYNVKEISAVEPQLRKLVGLVSAHNTPEHWTHRLSSALSEAVPDLAEQSRWQVHKQLEHLLKVYGGESVADEYARHTA